MSADTLSRLRSALAELVKLDAIPEFSLMKLRRARIVGQSGDRVSLQIVDREGEVPDAGQEARQPVWYGVPGCSADHTPGQEVLLAVAFAAGAQPIVFLAPPRGQPGHVPIRVRHEATTEIRFMGSAAGVVRVGPGTTAPVALAAPVAAMLTALKAFATSAAAATTAAQIATAAATLSTALNAIASPAATRLEAI